MRDGATEAAKAAGDTLNVVDAQNDAAAQANQLGDAVTKNPSAVIVNPVDSDAAGAAVKPVLNAKIPVVALDRAVNGADVTTSVSSDNVDGGRQAATALAKAIGEKGEILVLQGTPGTSASRDRGKGIDAGIAAFPNVKVVAKQPANFDRTQGLNVTTNLLQSHPNVVAIFAENDEMALGANPSPRRQGRQPGQGVRLRRHHRRTQGDQGRQARRHDRPAAQGTRQDRRAHGAIAGAVAAAEAAGCRVVLNLAPVLALAPDVLLAADPLVVNEHEALGAMLALGSPPPGPTPVDQVADATLVAKALLAAGVGSVVVTLGGAGALVGASAASLTHVPAEPIRPVDTTGAGDGFTGALAACLARGIPMAAAAQTASHFAAQAVCRAGAQEAYPGWEATGS